MQIVSNRTRFPKSCYRCYLVRPVGDFQPKNWQDRPARYSIVTVVTATPSLGSADAWRFMHNHDLIGDQNIQEWAIWLK